MNNDTEFEKRVRDLLIESSQSLDGRTASRLTQARYAALDHASTRSNTLAVWRNWAPAGAVAMSVLVTVFYVGQSGVGDLTPSARLGSGLDDLELLADGESYALSADTEQDLDADFYEWAAAVADDGSST